MLQRFTYSIVTLSLLVALFPATGRAVEFNPHFLVADADMVNTFAMTKSDIQAFLEEHGALGDLELEDHNGIERPASEIIWNAAQQFEINPQFLLVLLQREQSLVTHPNPSERRLDWAMGYAVCDDCSKDDPRIQKFKGFGNQIHYAAMQIREGYLDDLDSRGYTVTGMGPDITKAINGLDVTPQNHATAVLYTYTPHLHGNQNFVKIWHRWFVRHYPTGTLLQDASNGAVWLIQFGKKRPITSRTALYTRYKPERIITVQPTVLEAYTTGTAISFPNYSLLRSPKGTVFLLVDDTIRGIASMEAFRRIGFKEDEIIDVTFEDLEPYQRGPIITLDSVHPQGVLLQDSTTGGVWFVENGTKAAIHSREILNERFPGWPVNQETSENLAAFETVAPVQFPDGTLVAAHGSPDVFVIADGQRRWIKDEDTFHEYGWDFDNLVWTNERSVLLHELGENLDIHVEDLLLEEEANESLEVANLDRDARRRAPSN